MLDQIRAGRSVAELALELGMHQSTRQRWKRQNLVDHGVAAGVSSVKNAQPAACPKTGPCEIEAEIAAAKRASELFDAKRVTHPRDGPFAQAWDEGCWHRQSLRPLLRDPQPLRFPQTREASTKIRYARCDTLGLQSCGVLEEVEVAIGHPTPAGVRVGPTTRGSFYLARNDHQHYATPQRNRWNRQYRPPAQFVVLDDAERYSWMDSSQNLWGVSPGLPVLGTQDERIAKFPARSNPSDHWHGYPVSALDPGREFSHRPDPEIVSKWHSKGYIDERQRARIKRGKI